MSIQVDFVSSLFTPTQTYIDQVLSSLKSSFFASPLMRIARPEKQIADDEIIAEIQEMLKDRILNELAVIVLNISLASAQSKEIKSKSDRIQNSADNIAALINSLSSDALQQWKVQYELPTDVDSDCRR